MALVDQWFPSRLHLDISQTWKTQVRNAVEAYEYDCSYRFPKIMRSTKELLGMSEDDRKNESAPLTLMSKLWPLGAAIVAIALGWGEMRSQMEAEQQFRKDAITAVSLELSRIGASFEALEERSRALEDKSARIEERFIMLVSLMTEMKASIVELGVEARKQ